MAAHFYGEGITRRSTPAWEELLHPIEAHRPDWHRDALCRENHAGVSWFPGLGQGSLAAKAICRRCLVVTDCRAYAMANPDLVGIWGATDRRERGELRTLAAEDEPEDCCWWCGGAAPRGRGRVSDRPCCGTTPTCGHSSGWAGFGSAIWVEPEETDA